MAPSLKLQPQKAVLLPGGTKGKPPRNGISFPCDWLSSSFWPNSRCTWHTHTSQICSELQWLNSYLLQFECARFPYKLMNLRTWSSARGIVSGCCEMYWRWSTDGLCGSLQGRLWGLYPSPFSGLNSFCFLIGGKVRRPAAYFHTMNSTTPTPPGLLCHDRPDPLKLWAKVNPSSLNLL